MDVVMAQQHTMKYSVGKMREKKATEKMQISVRYHFLLMIFIHSPLLISLIFFHWICMFFCCCCFYRWEKRSMD